MTLPELEKLDTAIVILSAVERNVNLDMAEVGAFMRDPTASVIQAQGPGQAPAQLFQITSLRDQVVVSIAGGKFQFQDKSDATPGTGRLPDIAQGFVDLLRRQGLDRFTAYGINFDVVFDARGDQAASEIIADRYLDKDALVRRGQISVRGAGLRLYFQHAEAACELTIEPRMGKVDSPQFFAHINYHFDLPENTMPHLEDLKTRYHGLWPQFVDLLEALLIHP